MSGISFLIPLYLTDVHGLSSVTIGLLITLHAGSLLTTVRMGGQLSDRLRSRTLIIVSMSTQVSVMIGFTLLSGSASLVIVALLLALHGAGAGFALAVLHKVAMNHIQPEEKGAAAGVYSMMRFAGQNLGTTLGGVALAQALISISVIADAYHVVFLFIAGVGALGIVNALGLKELDSKGD
jgi:predicted MFS family arabinose efflux permease